MNRQFVRARARGCVRAGSAGHREQIPAHTQGRPRTAGALPSAIAPAIPTTSSASAAAGPHLPIFVIFPRTNPRTPVEKNELSLARVIRRPSWCVLARGHAARACVYTRAQRAAACSRQTNTAQRDRSHLGFASARRRTHVAQSRARQRALAARAGAAPGGAVRRCGGCNGSHWAGHQDSAAVRGPRVLGRARSRADPARAHLTSRAAAAAHEAWGLRGEEQQQTPLATEREDVRERRGAGAATWRVALWRTLCAVRIVGSARVS
jgi:hypothetical protein